MHRMRREQKFCLLLVHRFWYPVPGDVARQCLYVLCRRWINLFPSDQ